MTPQKKKRLANNPAIPDLLQDLNAVCFVPVEEKKGREEQLKRFFPRTFEQSGYLLKKGGGKATALCLGVVFSGGPAAGGHNVIAGRWDALQQFHPRSRLIGFLNGPSGIVEGKGKELTQKEIDSVRNLGGFDLIGSGRTKIETAEQMDAAFQTCEKFQLDGLVVIGGDDSNTNAALLAEAFLAKGGKTR